MVQNSGVLGYKTITLSGFCGTKFSLFSILVSAYIAKRYLFLERFVVQNSESP